MHYIKSYIEVLIQYTIITLYNHVYYLNKQHIDYINIKEMYI